MIDLSGKIAIITGGANGIGYATSSLFADLGAFVVIADTDVSREHLVNGHPSGRLFFIETDTASEQSVSAMASKVAAMFGGADILINGAVTFLMRGIDATMNDWMEVLKVNVAGYAIVAREVVPLMTRRGGGSIVNIASISALIAQEGHMTYSTTKAAVLGLTRCMAKELAIQNIRVNAISPGTVWTERTERYIGRTYGLDRREADLHPEIGGTHMLGRTADPDEIARAIAFLASTAATFVTAENLIVDGGYVAQ